MTLHRPEGRKSNQIRPILIETQINKFAEGSVLIQCGDTRVLCTASVEESVPNWLKGKGQGWITAEYSMLPRATHTRTKRDREKVSGRTQEIQRLIGRSLRSMINLKELGERTIYLDCDVLQADGGTRTTSITGSSIALAIAINQLLKNGKIENNPLVDLVSAVSIGIKNKEVLTDLDYEEDSSCEVDMNFVITGKGNFIEVQGTGEQAQFTKDELQLMTDQALSAAKELKSIQAKTLSKLNIELPV